MSSKELEQRSVVDELAVREVEGYIERVEKQAEDAAQTKTAQTAVAPPQPQVGDMGQVVAAQFASVSKPKIILPLNQKQLEEGLHHKIVDAVRWLAEWCVMMIKKYPGRVFYMPPNPL